jgi:type VI secretion system protein ImpB
MAESTQQKLSRVRPPRVQITYDVEIGGATQKKELPFVVGILSDLCGATPHPQPLRERRFAFIDRDNFDEVLSSLKPSLKLRVPNLLGAQADSMTVELHFTKLDHFHPTEVVKQVKDLNALLEARQLLVDLSAKLDGNEALSELLAEVVLDGSKRNALKGLLTVGTAETKPTPPTPAKKSKSGEDNA